MGIKVLFSTPGILYTMAGKVGVGAGAAWPGCGNAKMVTTEKQRQKAIDVSILIG
jgi:hypothetical protein